MRPRSGFAALTVCTLLACCQSGCATGRNVEILESRLTAHQDKLLATERQLVEAKREIQSLQDSLVSAREEAAARGKMVGAGPRPVSLAFSSLLTGGVDEDGHPGDEAVRVILQPISDEGGTIRAEGQLDLELLDVSAPAERRTKGHWSYSGQDLRDLWAAGLFSTGYTLHLTPEDGVLPEAALLIAKFTTPEGEQLEAVHTVKLDPDDMLAMDRGRSPVQKSAIQPVSAEQESLSDEELSRDLPDEFPIREAPKAGETDSKQSSQRFGIRGNNPVRTSDAWTEDAIPTLR